MYEKVKAKFSHLSELEILNITEFVLLAQKEALQEYCTSIFK